MKIAFFGGTFDPVHRGHLAVARAAANKFSLKRIYFAPADIPPHKQKRALTDFHHRFAMLALATVGDPRFVPSLIDAPAGGPNYSYETVRRFKKTLGSSDKLYFLIGMDAFKDIATWHKPVELLGECDFIVVSRPGYALADVARALPEGLRPAKLQSGKAIRLQSSTIHLLSGLNEPVSSTEIRASAKSYSRLLRYVPQAVAGYIEKERLYSDQAPGKQSQARAISGC